MSKHSRGTSTLVGVAMSAVLFIAASLMIYRLICEAPITAILHSSLLSITISATALSAICFLIRSAPIKFIRGSEALQSQLKYWGLFLASVVLISVVSYWQALSFTVLYVATAAWIVSLRSLVVAVRRVKIAGHMQSGGRIVAQALSVAGLSALLAGQLYFLMYFHSYHLPLWSGPLSVNIAGCVISFAWGIGYFTKGDNHCDWRLGCVFIASILLAAAITIRLVGPSNDIVQLAIVGLSDLIVILYCWHLAASRGLGAMNVIGRVS